MLEHSRNEKIVTDSCLPKEAQRGISLKLPGFFMPQSSIQNDSVREFDPFQLKAEVLKTLDDKALSATPG
ncbi:hypothetical protein KKA14_18475 [bacterium]|nr:hypothetical protein [bacterium]